MERRRFSPFLAAVFAAALAGSGCSLRSGERPAPRPAPAPQAGGASQDSASGPRRSGAAQPRPYARVITPDAVTKRGLFITHQIGDKLYFEIPRSELGKDMLVVRRTAVQSTMGGGGRASQVVRWERRGHRIYIRQHAYSVVADSTRSIYRAVSEMARGAILASFDIEAYGPDSAAVIDVTRLYTGNTPEFAAVESVASDRSWIEHVAAFPENIEVEAIQTGTLRPAQGGQQAGSQSTRSVPATVRVHWSMLRLPEQPMMPRLHDRRVGYISTSLIDYGRDAHRAEERRYIHRFRLEKKDPSAEVSEPVKPIVFWIDPATPEWLVPWVKKGVEAWQPAFEEAGFRNAIVAREAPAPEEDPDWSMHDARHSVIYWRPSTVQNATGGQIVDPRTGEIIKAEVNMYHNVMNLLRNWYFIQVGPLDPRARELPLPDSLMGRLVEYVVSHEVGHAIGFPHNMKASSTYPVDSLRSLTFLRRMGGHVATLMDYSRFNYVAQPEDSIPVELLVPQIGPYDRFAVMWGHKPIPGARTPDDELPVLDQWARMQDTIPWLRYETPGAPNDPGALTEAVGDADAVKATTLALKNLRRVMEMLLPAAERPGQDYDLLRELYDQAIAQWGRYMGHVAAVVGGAESQEKYGTGVRFVPVSKARQREAVRFLNEHAFRTPDYFIEPEILRRVEAEGAITRIRDAQARVLGLLLNEARMNRLIEYEALAGRSEDAYTLADLLSDLRDGVWTELTAGSVRVDVYRRNLQRSYLEAVERLLRPPAPRSDGSQANQQAQPSSRTNSDVRPALRGELVELERRVRAAIGRSADAMTRLHLEDVRREILRLLEPPRT